MTLTQITSNKSIRIFNAKGNLNKLMDIYSSSYSKFGEIYLTKIKYNNIKGWKKHKKINSNIFLISGRVVFIIVKKIKNKFTFQEYFLSTHKNNHIYIPKNNFFAFQTTGSKILL